MAQQSYNEEIVTIRYQKHSMWTMFKIGLFLWTIVYMFNAASGGNLALTEAMASMTEGAIEFCGYCQSLLNN